MKKKEINKKIKIRRDKMKETSLKLRIFIGKFENFKCVWERRVDFDYILR